MKILICWYSTECESNNFGTFTRDGDGLNCMAKCKHGYSGNRCQYCAPWFYVSNGFNGTINMSNHEGPICNGNYQLWFI